MHRFTTHSPTWKSFVLFLSGVPILRTALFCCWHARARCKELDRSKQLWEPAWPLFAVADAAGSISHRLVACVWWLSDRNTNRVRRAAQNTESPVSSVPRRQLQQSCGHQCSVKGSLHHAFVPLTFSVEISSLFCTGWRHSDMISVNGSGLSYLAGQLRCSSKHWV